MSLIYPNRYPGRWDPTSAQYPQGKFKNRSSPTAKDGSFCEMDWANDWAGFFGAILKNANITPNGTVDTATASQLYDALKTVILGILPKRTFQKSDFIRIPDVPGGLIVNFIRNASVTSNPQGDATITITYPAQFPVQACGSAFWLVDEAGNTYPATATCQGGVPGQSTMTITVRGVGSARTCAVSGFIVGN